MSTIHLTYKGEKYDLILYKFYRTNLKVKIAIKKKKKKKSMLTNVITLVWKQFCSLLLKIKPTKDNRVMRFYVRRAIRLQKTHP